MSDIILLDKCTIDKIAAGEVVERPVNVVKELVENAIDGNSTIINIEIRNGGQELIRVTDNGIGIKNEQVKTAFLRHATSKLTAIEDLEKLHSLGFRGEALSSISAVSKTEMITKTDDSLLGTQICIDGGKITQFNEIGAPKGTTVIVRQLFYNTPARKKFLKSASSEAAKIEDLVEKMMLSHPEISFTLIVNGKTKTVTPGNGELKDVIYKIYGKDIYDRLLKIDYKDESISVQGYIAKPEINMGTRETEVFFVNKRVISSKELSMALEEGYKGFLMQHRFPFAILFIDVLSDTIDVNVHPQKSEIRFSNIISVCEVLSLSVYNTLKEPELIPNIKVDSFKDLEPQSIDSKIEPENTNKTSSKAFSFAMPFETKRFDKEVEELNTAIEIEEINEAKENENEINKPCGEFVQQNIFEERLIDDAPIKEYKIIGQIFDTYWLVTLKDILYIVDQHAAHEKVNYERFLKTYKENDTPISQYLNPALIMHLSRQEESSLVNNMDTFRRIGFEIEEFGDRSYAIRGVPIELYGNTPEEMFKRLLFELYEHERVKNPEVVLEKLASMSCKASIKGGMRVSHEEMSSLMKQLMELDNPYHCPHGRPVFISISKYELEKKFKRIV